MDSRNVQQTSNDMGTFTGGCHCGDIKYTITIPKPTAAAPQEVIRCNCGFCRKPGLTNLHIADPNKSFKLLAPADRAQMGNYQPRSKSMGKFFCPACGVHVFMDGSYEKQGTTIRHFTVNAGTIDQPQEGFDLNHVKISYVDMLHNNFMGGKKDAPWSGGLP